MNSGEYDTGGHQDDHAPVDADSHEVVGKPFVVTEFNVHSSLPADEYEAYWKAVFDTIEEQDAAGGLFWEFNDRKLSEFTVMDGDPILTYFKAHAERMQNQTPKNSLSGKTSGSTWMQPEDVTLSYQMMQGKASRDYSWMTQICRLTATP